MASSVGPDLSGFSGFWSPGLVGFFILLILLSIFLTAVCSNCGRHSFELQEPQVQKTPSALIRVVKLEETRENPTIDQIQDDEKQFRSPEVIPVQFSSNSGHQVETEARAESMPEEEFSVQFTPWRSHLGAPQSQELNASNHVYETIGGGGGGQGYGSKASPTNHTQLNGGKAWDGAVAAVNLNDHDRNSVYAQVNKKLSTNILPIYTPEEQEDPSPSLPDRRTEAE
ncbi:uncharacterized protein KZ484_002735 [Pholidichthys leucotaenia]